MKIDTYKNFIWKMQKSGVGEFSTEEKLQKMCVIHFRKLD
jgi:hypothetical protein